MSEKNIYRVFVLGTAFWCIAIFSPPFFHLENLSSLSLLVRKFFSPVCHQISERSLHLFDTPFAVCARCSAIYFSFFLGIIFWKKICSLSFFSFPKVFLFLIPLALDVLLNVTGISEQISFLQTSHHLRRVITGIFVGFSFGGTFVPIFLSAMKEITLFNYKILFDYESQTK